MSHEPVDIDLFKQEFVELVDSLSWSKAVKHHLGGGLEQGANFEAAKKLRKKLLNEDKPMAAALMDTIVAAGVWTNHRCFQAGYNVSPKCILCGAQDDSEYHRLWVCPKILSSDHEDIVASNHLCYHARAPAAHDPKPAALRHECFWLRGIIQADWLKIPEAPQARAWAEGEFKNET